MTTLLQRIEAFMKANGMAAWQFGELALNDRHLVRQIREGRDLRMSTVERIDKFIVEYRSSEAA